MSRSSLRISTATWAVALAIALGGIAEGDAGRESPGDSSEKAAVESIAQEETEGNAIPPSEAAESRSGNWDRGAANGGNAVGEEERLAEDDLETSYSWMMVKLGLGLGLVVLLAWGAINLLRKSTIGQQFGGVDGAIRVAERAYLGPKKLICLVEIGDRTLALGVTEERITRLAEWHSEELNLPAQSATGGDSFSAQFRSLLGQTKESPIDERGGEK